MFRERELNNQNIDNCVKQPYNFSIKKYILFIIKYFYTANSILDIMLLLHCRQDRKKCCKR